MVLAGEAAQIVVQRRSAAIEADPVMMPGDRLLMPNWWSRHLSLRASARAVSSRRALGCGGLSNRSRTRKLSRSLNRNRSARSIASRAAGRALRRMKPVTSVCSRAAARASIAFSAGSTRNSIRSVSEIVRAMMRPSMLPLYALNETVPDKINPASVQP